MNAIESELRDAFSILEANKLPEHSELNAFRSKLPYLQATDVPKILPLILIDLLQHRETARAENGDLVIYFLDVVGDDNWTIRPETRARIERVLESAPSSQQAERIRKALFTPLPTPPGGRNSTNKYSDREECFSQLTMKQRKAILSWLRHVKEWPELASCRRDIERSLIYWGLASSMS